MGEAVRLALSEDADDVAAIRKRASEPDLDFEKVVSNLKRSGKLYCKLSIKSSAVKEPANHT